MRRALTLAAFATTVITSSITFVAPASAAFPGENGRIAYVTTVGDHRAIHTIDATGADPQPLIDLGTGRDAINPAWTWDGTMIAFAGQASQGGPFAIYTANTDGSGLPQQVTTPLASDSDPTWEPNASEIAFTRQRADGTSAIAIVNLGTGLVRSLQGLGRSVEPSWSPDGTMIAFATRQASDLCSGSGCRFAIWKASPDGATSGPLATDFASDLHHPDWSPDGAKIIVTFGPDEFSFGPLGLRIYDTSTGTAPSFSFGLCGIEREPSFSPDGRYVVLTSTNPPPPGSSEWPESKLCAMRVTDGAHLFEGSTPARDAAWGSIPGSAPRPPPPPPGPDTTPPTIEFSMVTNDQGWLKEPALLVIARDASGVDHFICYLDGQYWPVHSGLPAQELRGGIELFGVTEGPHVLRCTAVDIRGNQASKDQTVKVDTTPPTLGAISLDINPKRIDQVATISVPFSENGSGIYSADIRLTPGTTTFPMSPSGSTLVGTIDTSVPAGFTNVSVHVFDNNFNNSVATFDDFLVVYDPSAGSTAGTGWIVPGTPNSAPGDDLPGGVNGATKGSFSFKAQYKSLVSTTPSGSLNFTYGNQFKLQSEAFDWLMIGPWTAQIHGTATIRGMSGSFPFWVTVQDGVSIQASDRFELRVWPAGADTFREPLLYQASGDAGGQIQIKR